MRQSERAFVVEGATLVAEAFRAGVAVESVFVAAGTDAEGVAAEGTRVYELAPGVLERVADTVTPQPVMAVVSYIDVELDALSGASMVVVCVDVRDPGNAGTVLRSAEAAGADGVICCSGSVDVYNPKTVRASAGALFHVPVVVGGDPVEVLARVGGWGLRRLGADAHQGEAYTRSDLRAPVAFVVGNESAGIPELIAASLDGRVTIPMAGRAESLNVGMATAVLCFEAARQRRMEGERG